MRLQLPGVQSNSRLVIGTESYPFPTYEHHQKIRAHHQHKHRKHEEPHVSEKAIEAWITMHVAGGKNENTKANTCDDQHEDRRQRIELIAPFNVENRTARDVGDGNSDGLIPLLRRKRRTFLRGFLLAADAQSLLGAQR